MIDLADRIHRRSPAASQAAPAITRNYELHGQHMAHGTWHSTSLRRSGRDGTESGGDALDWASCERVTDTPLELPLPDEMAHRSPLTCLIGDWHEIAANAGDIELGMAMASGNGNGNENAKC